MSDNKNRFKALLSEEEPSNKFMNKNDRNKRNTNSRWKMDDSEKKNMFQSGRGRGRRGGRGGRGRTWRGFGKNRRPIQTKIDPNFKPDIIGHGEVTFIPQKKIAKQRKIEKPKLKPLIKNEEDEVINDEDLAITLAMAQKYQYVTESEEEGEEEDEITDQSKDNSAW